MTDTVTKPKAPPVPTLEEARTAVYAAHRFVAELDERNHVMVQSMASLHDELKIARRKLEQAEKALILAAKRTPLLAVHPTKNTTTKAS